MWTTALFAESFRTSPTLTQAGNALNAVSTARGMGSSAVIVEIAKDRTVEFRHVRSFRTQFGDRGALGTLPVMVTDSCAGGAHSRFLSVFLQLMFLMSFELTADADTG
jgi:hypothetical protein